ncbi:hypothetical protein [Nocardioides marmoribigeumensis]|uniref:DUF222 domain-containing protein n=1 Tax=Nocardioides marmoribigeumensis TaxID=433649 RepID=A0ABU2BP86_9ACTN|nr:hypothetical protein [Nocardioides marmoribigeumensis]MDR7360457.1 hypothetical protein [Nocardioides marmoribigeumensis]
MAELAQIRREHVHRSVAEYDPANPLGEHRLVQGHQEYDAATVVLDAYWLATGANLEADGEMLTDRDCALLLRGLGFEVQGPSLPPVRWTNAATVGTDHSHATWALAARERLEEAARVYRSVVTVAELADFVQRRSQIRSAAASTSWLGDVLGRVATGCADRAEPFLSSLCVDARGRVGASYATSLRVLRGVTPEDVDAQSAQERLDCHRHFGAELPEDGGRPTVFLATPAPRERAAREPRAPRAATARATTTRSSTRTATPKAAPPPPKPLATCPVHFTVLPPSGICDYCD